MALNKQHEKKKYMARRMLTKAEVARGVSLFDSKAWNARRVMRAFRADTVKVKTFAESLA